jgi:hypothetical protein
MDKALLNANAKINRTIDHSDPYSNASKFVTPTNISTPNRTTAQTIDADSKSTSYQNGGGRFR